MTRQVVWLEDMGDGPIVRVMRVAWHDTYHRSRKPEYTGLKSFGDDGTGAPDGWTVNDLSTVDGSLLMTGEDVTLPDGVSVYNETPDEYLAWVITDVPVDVSFHVVEQSQIPGDHACNHRCKFKDAWDINSAGDITTNRDKAEIIQMRHIRLARNKALIHTDAAWRKAMEEWIRTQTPESRLAAVQLSDEAQTLRDIPVTFDLSGYTISELKEAMPEGL
jgi:hypothetical protein